MQIIISITDKNSIDGINAVGAKDLLEYFLPKSGIKAKSIRVSELTDENRALMLKNKPYKEYSDKAVL